MGERRKMGEWREFVAITYPNYEERFAGFGVSLESVIGEVLETFRDVKADAPHMIADEFAIWEVEPGRPRGRLAATIRDAGEAPPEITRLIPG